MDLQAPGVSYRLEMSYRRGVDHLLPTPPATARSSLHRRGSELGVAGSGGGSHTSRVVRSHPGSVAPSPGPTPGGTPRDFLPEVLVYHSHNASAPPVRRPSPHWEDALLTARYRGRLFADLFSDTPVRLSVKKESAARTERGSLPQAPDQRRSLVAAGRYTVYRTANGGKLTVSGSDIQHRSLPNSRAQNLIDDADRKVNSAPNKNGRPAPVTSLPPSLPRINNLINGKPSSQTPGQVTHQVRQATKFSHGRKRHKRIKEKSEEGAAGMSTKDHDVQSLTSHKFASSWANARVDHVTRDTARDDKESVTSPRPEANANDSNVTRSSKDYPKPWLMSSKPKPTTDATKSTSISNDQNSKLNEKGAGGSEGANRDSKTETNTATGGDETKDSKQNLTRRVTLPARPSFAAPRRDRTRLRIQRAKTQALLDARQLEADDNETDGNGGRLPRKYSNIDAANVYYVNAAAAVGPPPGRRHSKLPDKNDSMATTEGAHDESEIKDDKPKEYILNKREAAMYVNIRSVYDKGTEKYRQTREKRFYDRVEKVQREKWKQEHDEFRRRQQRARESKERQARQLKRVRERFDEEQVRRFNNQYVTGKVLEHEWQTRHIYGLPDNLTDQPQYAAKLKAKVKRPERAFDPEEKLQKNRRRYKRLFKVKRGPRWDPRAKTPKMEGIDTIVVGETENDGETQGRKVEVKDIVGDALQLLEEESESSRSDSPRKTNPDRGSSDQKASTKQPQPQKTAPKAAPTKTTSSTGHQGARRADFLSLKPTDDDLDDGDSLDLSDDDDPEEDIFEKARRKYNIVLDSDEDL